MGTYLPDYATLQHRRPNCKELVLCVLCKRVGDRSFSKVIGYLLDEGEGFLPQNVGVMLTWGVGS